MRHNHTISSFALERHKAILFYFSQNIVSEIQLNTRAQKPNLWHHYCILFHLVFISVRLVQFTQLCPTLWTAAHQASLSIIDSRRLLRLLSIELVMPSNHLILCCPLLLLPSIFPGIRVFSSESVLHIRWPRN